MDPRDDILRRKREIEDFRNRDQEAGEERRVEFLLAKRPKLCVFVEPIYEWYDPANFIDHLAMRGHAIRNFLHGMPGALHALQEEGRIEILKEHRVEFGSLLHEGYSQTIWRPI